MTSGHRSDLRPDNERPVYQLPRSFESSPQVTGFQTVFPGVPGASHWPVFPQSGAEGGLFGGDQAAAQL